MLLLLSYRVVCLSGQPPKTRSHLLLLGGLTPQRGLCQLLLLGGGYPPQKNVNCYCGGLTGVSLKNVLLLLFALLTLFNKNKKALPYMFKTPNYGLQTQLKSKSGMNGHPIRPLDTIICVSEFWASQLSFLTLKPCNYGLQERLMSKKVAPPKKCSGHRKIVKPETIPSFYLAH